MERNQDSRNAWDFVEHTGISVFLTGKAGTGKTTFLRAVKKHSTKRSLIVAPTGVAAINAGGMTIHSFFQLPLSPFLPEINVTKRYAFSKEKRKIIRTLDLL
ncbi:sigma 54-interacting transcriptional regulator [Prevotella histicola]